MENQTISQAIGGRNLLSFSYHGLPRVVEPHAYGTSTRGNDVIRCFQIGGESESGEAFGWKLMLVDEIEQLTVLEARFAGPRDGYKQGDRGMSRIYRQL
jgi:hypothetical protein